MTGLERAAVRAVVDDARIGSQHRVLDDLAAIANGNRPSDLRCSTITLVIRYAERLNDRGVSGETIRAISREYARRVDQLGPDEFDRRVLVGA